MDKYSLLFFVTKHLNRINSRAVVFFGNFTILKRNLDLGLSFIPFVNYSFGRGAGMDVGDGG